MKEENQIIRMIEEEKPIKELHKKTIIKINKKEVYKQRMFINSQRKM